MRAELFAVVAALCFASGSVVVKRATQAGDVLVGFLISLSVNALVVGLVAVLTVERWAVPVLPLVLFALAGLCGPGLARLLMMRSVRDAGASVAVPVQASSNPLISSAAGLLLFGESAGLGRLVALLLVVSGIWSCARGGSANVVAPDAPRARPARSLGPVVLLLPLPAGAAYASADILRKAGLSRYDEPVLGALIGTVAALAVWVTVVVLRPSLRAPVRLSQSSGWFVLNGVLLGTAQLALLFALSTGDLSVVSPIVASQPVIVVVLGALVLRDVERVRWGSLVGAALVVLGVVWLSTTS